jgi:hypothetical protein
MDIEEMKINGPFDLSTLEEAKKHADDIFGRVSVGNMPCDAAWSPPNVQKFKQWLDEGMQPL